MIAMRDKVIHPDADWSGYVPQRTSKKHPNKTPSAMKDHFTMMNNAVCPCECAQINDWIAPGRRKIDKNCDTFSLTGGPIPSSNPSILEPSHWETEAQCAMRQKTTEINQLNTKGRSMHVRGKKKTTPAFEEASTFNANKALKIKKENPYRLNDGLDHKIESDTMESTSFNEYNSSFHYNNKRSFLSGLVKEIAGNIDSIKPVPVAPYATEGHLATDPYISSEGERCKNMLLENYKCALPGYTGKRSFIDKK